MPTTTQAKTEYLVRVITKYTSRPGIDPVLADALHSIADLLIDMERRLRDA